jgi:hypothetical protein
MGNFRVFQAVETQPIFMGIRGISNIMNTMIYAVGIVIGAIIISKINKILGFCFLFGGGPFMYFKMKEISKVKVYNHQKNKITKPRIIQVRNSSVFRY